MLDVIIKNAKIVDGTGAPWFYGEIGILEEEIVSIKNRIDEEARKIIDAEGLVVCPGFIDMHTHSDLRVLKYPQEEAKLMQGITTALLGQDGLSVAPIDDKNVKLMQERISGLDGTYVETWTWRSMEEYLNAIEEVEPATNNMMLVPYSSVRVMGLGWDNRASTAEELEKMKKILNQAFAEGACGLSTGLIYPPGMYADRNELVELLRITGENGGFFAVHMRNESDKLIDSIEEVISACQEAECPLHISHLKVAGKRNWGRSKEAIALINKARADGLDVTFDQYPYIAGSTMLDCVIPPWYHEGGQAKLIERLKDPAIREKIKADLKEPSTRWENQEANCGWDGIFVTSVKTDRNRFAEGRSIKDIAEELGKSPLDTVADLLIEEDSAVTMVNFYGHEEDVERFMKHPGMCVCTDGIAGGKPHPRLYGSYPRILGRYVRERKVLSLEEAIGRMSSNPARRLNLQDRGILREGMVADIVIFNEETIIDLGTFENPNKYPKGIEYVLINGKLAVENGKVTGYRPGRVLRLRK